MLRSSAGASITKDSPPSPEVLLQAEIVESRGTVADGQLIVAVGTVWKRIFQEIQRDSAFLFRFAKNSRAFEEFIAGAYDQTGEWNEVILTVPLDTELKEITPSSKASAGKRRIARKSG